MERTRERVSWSDVAWSTAIVTAAWIVAFSPMWWTFFERWTRASSVLTIVGGGLAIGGAQWVVTSRRLGAGAKWALMYAAGWACGLWCGFYFGFFVPSPLAMGAAGGLIVGVAQAVSLRPYLRNAAIWVLASVVISIAGCWAGVAAGNWAYNHQTSEANAYLYGSALCGVITGFLTSASLRRLTSAR